MFNVIVQELASILIFFYAIKRFSKMIMRSNIHALQKIIAKITDTPVKSLLLGIVSSGIMQSNKAVSSISLTLVNAGVVSGISILPILFGAPIGVSSTAFLVSCKWESMEEVMIIAGAILKKTKHKNIGHSIFYLGLLLFALELMGNATSVLKNEQWFIDIFSFSNNTIILFIVGCVASCVLQSGALVISIITILTSCKAIPLYNAICMCLGVVLGSSLSLIVVVMSMNKEAKNICYQNICYMAIGTILTLFFIPFIDKIFNSFSDVGIAFAISNLLFRILATTFAVVVFQIFSKKHLIIQYTHNKAKELSIKNKEEYTTAIIK